MEEQEKGREG
jgi:hypothetical protein